MSRMVSLETRIIYLLIIDGWRTDGWTDVTVLLYVVKRPRLNAIVQPFSRESRWCVVTVYHMHTFFESIHTDNTVSDVSEDSVGKKKTVHFIPLPRCNSPDVQEHPSSRRHRRPVSGRNDHGACILRHVRGMQRICLPAPLFHCLCFELFYIRGWFLPGSYRVPVSFHFNQF
jgi:hypothetical protein